PCPPCSQALPAFQQAAIDISEFSDTFSASLSYTRTDCYVESALCAKLGVDMYPTVLLFRHSDPQTEGEGEGESGVTVTGAVTWDKYWGVRTRDGYATWILSQTGQHAPLERETVDEAGEDIVPLSPHLLSLSVPSYTEATSGPTPTLLMYTISFSAQHSLVHSLMLE
ncbi:hypothetical protein KIPB_015483, partial [Kipferlia bialata]